MEVQNFIEASKKNNPICDCKNGVPIFKNSLSITRQTFTLDTIKSESLKGCLESIRHKHKSEILFGSAEVKNSYDADKLLAKAKKRKALPAVTTNKTSNTGSPIDPSSNEPA